MDDHGHKDSIGLAELIPDMGVFIASLFAQQGLMKMRAGNAGGGYQQIAKTLSEQFMPDKSGKGVEDEILFNEMLMFFSPAEKAKVFDLFAAISKDERRFLINTLALWAAKYQKEHKKAQKGPDGKETSGGSAFMEPLTEDNPAVKFMKAMVTESETPRTIEETIEELRKSGMIQQSLKDKFSLKWKAYQEESGKSTEEFITAIVDEMLHKHPTEKQTVGPLGLCFAYAIGKGDSVQLIGMKTTRAFFVQAFGRSKKRT